MRYPLCSTLCRSTPTGSYLTDSPIWENDWDVAETTDAYARSGCGQAINRVSTAVSHRMCGFSSNNASTQMKSILVTMKRMTRSLELWKEDAERLGLSVNTQKGLLFLLALRLTYFPVSDDPDTILKWMQSVSPKVPDFSIEDGGNFHDNEIAQILNECATKAGLPIRARVLSFLHTTYPSIPFPTENRLPDLDPSKPQLGESHTLGRVTMEQIGRQIDEDLEGAFLAGLMFGSAYYSVDPEATVSLVRTAIGCLPAHMHWMHRRVYHEPERIEDWNLLAKVVDANTQNIVKCFDPTIVEMAWYLATVIADPQFMGKSEEDLLADNHTEFGLLCPVAMASIIRANMWPDIETSREFLRNWGIERPPTGEGKILAMGRISKSVYARTGYDFVEDSTVTVGERLDVRACLVFETVVNTILNPDWVDTTNAAANPAKSASQAPKKKFRFFFDERK